jgi:hypothetical protein
VLRLHERHDDRRLHLLHDDERHAGVLLLTPQVLIVLDSSFRAGDRRETMNREATSALQLNSSIPD